MKKEQGQLILVRHGESTANKNRTWSGWMDVELTEKGREQAREAAALLKNEPIDIVFTSTMIRAKQTWEEIREELAIEELPVIELEDLKERSYGDLEGVNKDEFRKIAGEEKYNFVRKSRKFAPPNGESLDTVSERVIPCYHREMMPPLREGKNVLVVAHRNSLRVLMEHIEDTITDEELPTAGTVIYTVDHEGKKVSSESRGKTPEKTLVSVH